MNTNFATIAPVTNQTQENVYSSGGSFSLNDLGLSDASITAIATIAHAASSHGIEAYLVGGMVRDIVARLPKITTSPDVTIIGDAIKFAQSLAAEYVDCSLISASQLYTAKVEIAGVTIDIASARSDLYEPWGALPQITLIDDIEADLHRRDFAMNAMAIRLFTDGLGVVIDPFNGQRDVAEKTMRVIRNDSFAEDPLRMMRGVRLAARYGYTFDDDTAKSIRGSLDHLRKMCAVSPQRVFQEFRLWFRLHEDLDMLTTIAAQNGILNIFLPCVNFPHGVFRQPSPSTTELERFAAFAYLAPTDVMTDLAERLRMPSEWRAIVADTDIVRDVAEKCRSKLVTDVELWRSLSNVRDEAIKAAISLESDTVTSKRLADYIARLRSMRTDLNGDDLIALGVAQGPMIGQLLDALLRLRIEGTITTADEECAYVRRRLSDG